MIRLAQISDLRAIKQLTEACALAMQKKGIFQWNEHYPPLQQLKSDIEAGEMYVWEEHDQILGIIVLSPKMDEEYIPIKWLTPNKNNLYIHRLATHPSVWGQGYAQKLMDFGENFARKKGYESVRLDTFSQNSRNQRFYEQRAYQKLGNIFFPKQSEHPFYCYELLL